MIDLLLRGVAFAMIIGVSFAVTFAIVKAMDWYYLGRPEQRKRILAQNIARLERECEING